MLNKHCDGTYVTLALCTPTAPSDMRAKVKPLFTHVFVTSPLCNRINSLLSQHFSTCRQLTLRSKRAVDWLIVVYCSSVNFATINATMSLYSINFTIVYFPIINLLILLVALCSSVLSLHCSIFMEVVSLKMEPHVGCIKAYWISASFSMLLMSSIFVHY